MSRLDVIPRETLDRFIADQLRSGAVTAEEAADSKAMDHIFRVERLRALAQVSIDEIARGEGVMVDDLDAHFREIWTEVTQRVERRATDRRSA